MSYIIAVAVQKICETHTFDRYQLSIADLAKNHFLACGNAKKRELDNNYTILETCVLKPFHGQKRKEKLFFRREVERTALSKSGTLQRCPCGGR